MIASVWLTPVHWVHAYVRFCFNLHVPQDTLAGAIGLWVAFVIGVGWGIKLGHNWERRMRTWAYGLEDASDGCSAAVPGDGDGREDRQQTRVPRGRSGSYAVPRWVRTW